MRVKGCQVIRGQRQGANNSGGGGAMAAYVIVEMEVTDTVRFSEYQRLAPPVLAQYGGKLLVAGPPAASPEGDWHPGRITLLEFPSLERAQAWHDAPEYE